MTEGMWTLHDDGRFELQEPYATMLEEAKVVATKAWTEALCGYLEERSPYSAQELAEELVKRNEREDGKLTIFEEFVLQALGGEL